jgi:class 3 adenylate cyclase/CHASE2 domain-containing sensor protein
MSLSQWWRARRRRLLQLWVVGLLASLFVTSMASLDDLVSVQRVLDILMYLRQPAKPSDVVIVTLVEPAVEARAQRDLIPREDLAKVLRGLHRAGAAAVGLDVSLRTPGDAAEDAALARAIVEFAENGRHRLVVADTMLPERGPLADPAVTRLLTLTTPDLPEDRDGVVRRVESRGARDLPFAAGLASAADTPRPWAGLRINYVGPSGSFPSISSDAVAALATTAADGVRETSLRGKIVLIGRTIRNRQDVHDTPHGRLSDIEIQANIIHMLLTHTFVRPAGWLVGSVMDLLAILAAGVVMVAVRPLWGTLWCTAGALSVGAAGSYVAFSRDGYWIDFLLPVAAVALLGISANVTAHRRLRVALGRYVSPEVAARIERNPADLAGERRQVSILFSDIRGFTTLSEQVAPEQMARRLTEYFDAMSSVISAHRGMVSDFIGDGILAVFGAPLDDPDHARHAVGSACAMQQTLEQLNQRWRTAGLAPLRIGIGIHTGEVFAGNVGGAGKVKYAVVGDTVNLASRVEGLNKELGTTTLMTEATYYAAGLEMLVRDHGLLDLKGRHDPVRIYEVPAPSPEETTR